MRKSEELSDSSGETGLVTTTQAACGPACDSNIARAEASGTEAPVYSLQGKTQADPQLSVLSLDIIAA